MLVFKHYLETGNHFLGGSVITLGNFDGIHHGHRALIERLKTVAKEKNLPSIVVTYYPNPALVLSKNKNLKTIYTEEVKEEIIESFQPDALIVIPFTLELSEMSSYDFIQKILYTQLNARHIIIGFNHFFGKNREGDFNFLETHSREFGYRVEKIDPVYFEGEQVSSSVIRNCIRAGEMEKANKLLGRSFRIRGTVVKGFQRGRLIGFPTANVEVSSEMIVPSEGVYAVYAYLHGKRYGAMLNIGKNPTFENEKRSIEGNLFDFSEDIYGETIEYEFIARIRNEVKFASVEELKNQLQEDRLNTIKILSM